MKYNLIKNIKNIRSIKKIVIMVVLATFIIFLINIFIFGDDTGAIKKDRQDRLNAIIGKKQIIDCAGCHTTGQSPFTAKDTINIQFCFRCHREDIKFLVPISRQVHTYHKGNASALPGYPNDVDYNVRHKDISQDCNTCHIFGSGISPACTVCHSGRHIEDKKGAACESCHGSLDNLFEHKSILLETHNIFGNESCRMCHSADKITLELVNGNRVLIDQTNDLCKQCHFRTYEEWKRGDHISGVECVMCHDPHSPKYINQTILKIAKEIALEKKVEETPPKSKKEKDAEGVLRRKYSYDTVEE